MNQSQERDVLSDGFRILGILTHQAGIPFLILADDVFRTADEHGQQEKHDSPDHERQYQTYLVFGEKEECQPDDAIEFDEGAQHDKERRPEVFLFLYTVISQQDACCNSNIELLHIQGCK